MANDFRFDSSKSFNENFAAFLDALGSVDGEMAAILRTNSMALAAMVRDGDRDANARVAFNAAIAAALDAVTATDPEPESS